jgi:hypothetical protein
VVVGVRLGPGRAQRGLARSERWRDVPHVSGRIALTQLAMRQADIVALERQVAHGEALASDDQECPESRQGAVEDG